MLHVTGLRYTGGDRGEGAPYPFGIPLVRRLGGLTFEQPVTFFVGENGSGKSTLLEAIAVAAGSVTVGDQSVQMDQSLAPARELARFLKLSWRRRTHRGFFLRSEDFFNFCKRMNELRQEMEQGLRETDEAYKGKSILARQLARGVYQKSIAGLSHRYGEDLDARSHGESFLQLFQARMVPDGLYILDEPETPLSPARQLAFIAMLMEMVARGSQFLIATHSPILMAFPGAEILSFDTTPPRSVAYDTLEHVKVTREFLNGPERFLRHLRSESES